MSSVRVTVYSRGLGDITVDLESRTGYHDAAIERAEIEQLLTNALGKIRRAYGIEETP